MPNRKLTKEEKQRISEELKRQWMNGERNRNFSEEIKKKMSEAKKGKNHWNWKGGIGVAPSTTKEYQKNYQKEWNKKNGEYRRIHKMEWNKRNKEKIKEYQRRWREKEPKERKRERIMRYLMGERKIKRKERRQSDPKFRLDSNMATAVWLILKGKKAWRKWQDLVGYSVKDLMRHLEKQFDDKMFWQNYGSYWWIDHIIPRSHFKYEVPEDPQFKRCWALENLQPMEKIANIKKGNK